MTSPLKRIELHPHEAAINWYKLWPILAVVALAEARHLQKQIEIERTKVRINAKEVDVKLRCQLRRGLSLSSIFEAKPILKFWVYYLTFLKLRLMTRSIIGLRFWETFYQLLKWKKLKGMSKSIKNCANFTEYQLIVDSTEQPIVRPIDYELQKDYYSGKKDAYSKKSILFYHKDKIL